MNIPFRPPIRTVADLLRHLGDVPASRVRFTPVPGTATVADLATPGNELCEIIEGVLVEKAVGQAESFLGGWILTLLNNYIDPLDLGMATGEAGFTELNSGNLRAPDVSFFAWDTLPGRTVSTTPYPRVTPDFAVEVLSPSNTRAEMDRKRAEFFASGTRLIWEIYPKTRTARAYTSPSTFTDLTASDTLDASPVVPGFTVDLGKLFARIDRKARDNPP